MKTHNLKKTIHTINLRKLTKPTALCISVLFVLSILSVFSSSAVQAATTPTFGNTAIGANIDNNEANAQSISYFTTPSAPTLTSNGTTLALVVRGTNNQIYYRFYMIATQTWTDWIVVPSGTTVDCPAATVLGNMLYIVVRGMASGQIWFGSIDLGTNAFSGWTLLSGATLSPPTLTSNGTSLILVVQGANNEIFYRFYTVATQTWAGWTALPSGSTPNGPTSATMLGNKLYFVVIGMNTSQLWYSNIDLGTNAFSGWTLLDGSTPSKPTLTS